MNKTEYNKKLEELAGKGVTMENIFPGLIFKCSWNGMADYYEVIGKTAKSLKLRKLRWETCSAAEAGEEPDGDPTYRWTKLLRDENDEPVPEKDYSKKEIINMVRVKERKDGTISFKSPNYSGDAYVRVCTSDFMQMYWG